MADFDDFASHVHASKSETQLKKNFFQDRSHKPNRANPKPLMKGFASEFLVVVEVLHLFGKVVLPPGVASEHYQCLEMLVEMLDLLRSGDEVVSKLDRLTAVIDDHRRMFMNLYPQHSRPKLHHLAHKLNAM